jgi:hypothetical protein
MLFLFLLVLPSAHGVALPCQAVGGRASQLTALDSAVERVHWLNERVALLETTRFDLWRSDDGGRTWLSQLDLLPHAREAPVNGSGSDVGVVQVIRTVRSATVLLDGFANHMWRSDDAGATYQYIPTAPGVHLTDFQPHPTHAGTVLARWSEAATGRDVLVVTDNAGNSWRQLTGELYYNRFAWGHNAANATEPAVWFMRWAGAAARTRYAVQLVSSADELQTAAVLQREHVADFLVTWADRFMLVAEFKDNTTTAVSLVTSADVGASFAPASFPDDLQAKFFTFLDHSEGRVFIHARRGAQADFGTVFASDAQGLSYAQSLAQVSVENGVVEFRPFRGVDGLYVANQKRVPNDWFDARVITVISHDKGGSWKPLPATNVRDEQGKPIECSHAVAPDGLVGCFLSFSVLGKPRFMPQRQFGSFHSTTSAPGFAVAVGNVGPWYDRAEDDADAHAAFLTTDAGASWQRVRNGSHVAEIADQGNVIVLARDSAATDTLIWSADAGATWRECLFAASPVFVSNILSEPTKSGTDIIVIGTQWQGGRRVGVVVFVDLAEYARQCGAADYDEWRPAGNDCVLGERLTYMRRKPEAACHSDMLPQPMRTACECEVSDYECDFCYQRDSASGDSGPCARVFNAECPQVLPLSDVCPQTRSKGYRRIPGNQCTPPNANYEPEQLAQCSVAHKSPSVAYTALIATAGVVVVLAIAACVCVVQFRRNAKFSRWVRKLGLPGVRRAPPALATSAFGDDTADDDDLLEDKGGY